jgi:hypothetical protein
MRQRFYLHFRKEKIADPKHWKNRPPLAELQASPSFHSSDNVKSDHLVGLAL